MGSRSKDTPNSNPIPNHHDSASHEYGHNTGSEPATRCTESRRLHLCPRPPLAAIPKKHATWRKVELRELRQYSLGLWLRT